MASIKSKSGFTLIELSIVLVIIGLLVGGVFGGATLIYSAKATSALQSAESIKTAFSVFQSQYNALPGDFATASTDISTTSLDGNGSNTIDTFVATLTAPQTTYGENVEAWVHLNATGIYPSGVASSCATAACTTEAIGTTVPSSNISTATGISIRDAAAGGAIVFAGAAATGQLSTATVSASVAKIYDKKVDGTANPAAGFVTAYTTYTGLGSTAITTYGSANVVLQHNIINH